MAEDDEVSSFSENGYFNGPLKIVFSSNLEREAGAGGEWLTRISEASETPISRIMLTILQEAVLAKTAYLHIQPSRDEILIRYRIDRKLWDANAFPKHVYAPLCARLKMISSINIAERRVPQFGRFLYKQDGFLYEMRMSTIPTQFGEDFVINILRQSGHGDYAIDRHEWQDQMTVEDVMTQIYTSRQRNSE